MPDEPITQSLVRAGLSRSFAHHVVAGTRVCGMPLARWLREQFGITVPPLVGRTDEEVEALSAIYEPAPPNSIARRLEQLRAA